MAINRQHDYYGAYFFEFASDVMMIMTIILNKAFCFVTVIVLTRILRN